MIEVSIVGTGVREVAGVVSLVTKPSVGVTVGVLEAVGTGVLVPERVVSTEGAVVATRAGIVVLDGADVFVGTGTGVLVGKGVLVTVGSGVFVGVGNGVSVAVGTGVSLAPGTGVSEGPGIGVSLGMGVSVNVGTGVSVGVGVTDGAIWVISILLLISEVSIVFSVNKQLASTHLEAIAVR